MSTGTTTPRTDALDGKLFRTDAYETYEHFLTFARTIERELAAANARVAELEANQCDPEPVAWAGTGSYASGDFDGPFNDVKTAYYTEPLYRKAKL